METYNKEKIRKYTEEEIKEFNQDVKGLRNVWCRNRIKHYVVSKKAYLVKNILNRHNRYDPLLERVLMCCYEDIDEKYKKLIPINIPSFSYPDTYGVVKTDEMGIHYTEDIKDDYLQEIEDFFINSNYTKNVYDIFYYKNICNKNLKKIQEMYPNLDQNTIRTIILYIKDMNKVQTILEYLKDKNSETQKQVCKIITPMLIDITAKKDYVYPERGFIEFILYLLEGQDLREEEDKRYVKDLKWKQPVYKDLDFAAYAYNSLEHSLKTKNTYYLQETNTLFLDLFLENLEAMNEDTINLLCNLKATSLKNTPNGTGNITKEEIYKEVEDCSFTGGSWWPSSTSYHDEYQGTIEINSIKLHKNKVKNQKELLKEYFQMALAGTIDFTELTKYKEPYLILDLMEYPTIETKGKVKVYEHKISKG